MATGGVVIGYLHPGEVSHSFHESMRNLMLHDLGGAGHVVGVIAEESGPRIADGRNSVVRKFLGTNAEWLLFIDADMGFEPDSLDALLDVADKSKPIVGGLCFGQRKGPHTNASARHLESVPTIYQWVENGPAVGVVPVTDYPRNTLVKCDSTGGAFFLTHRSTFEKMAESHPPPREWFAEAVLAGQVFGEDIVFFRRAAELGIPTHVHTGVKTSHYKRAYLDESTYVPPDDIPTFVVIPMKNRFDLTKQLLDQLVEQGEHEAVFVCDNGSNTKTKNRLSTLNLPGVEVFTCDDANLHQMWNAGIDEALRRKWPCNVAILNNDITIAPRFLSGLGKALRSDPLLGAVCPNYDGREGSGVVHTDDLCYGRYDGTGGLAGFAFVVKGESGYRFPEELQFWYGDNDMMMHILASGHRAGIVLDVACEHVNGGGNTGDWDDPEMRAVLEQDRKAFEARWGVS